MIRLIFLLALFAGNAAADYSPAARQVLAAAPQLEAFAGSKGNFESLASGLLGETAVRLVTLTPEGMREIVTFAAAGRLKAEETVHVLENARYHLLERGIAEASGWDIALVLMGRMDIAPSGPAWQPGLLTPADPHKPIVVSLRPFAGSPANYRSLWRGLTQGTAITLADPIATRARVRFVPQCTLAAAEAREALLEAAARLDAEGRGEPTMNELRGAVVGALERRCGALGS
jgi:hypothetical protein